LKEAASRFGADDLSHRIPVSGDDELAQLGNAFNAMAGSLDKCRADLRESEQRFRALVHHASDVFTVIGLDTVIRYQSPAIEQVLGHPATATIGRSFLDLVEPDDHGIARQLVEERPTQQAFHDALTSLPNRALFQDRLGRRHGCTGRRRRRVISVTAWSSLVTAAPARRRPRC
jgi:PAS domain-containing protein